MSPLWLYEIPLWELGALIIGICLVYTVGGLLVARPWVMALPEPENEAVGFMLSIAGVAYAVLLAMIAVGAWEGASEVEGAVQREANALASIHRDMEAYDPAARAELRRLVREYAHFVVTDEWPALQQARTSPRTELAARRLSSELTSYVPSDMRGQLVYPLVLDRVAEFTDARRLRLLVGTRGLDAVTWFVVVLGGMITMAFSFFLRTRSLVTHAVLSGLAGSILGLLIFLIVAMDHPLWGEVSVSNEPYREVLEEARPLSDLAGLPAAAP